MIDRAKFLRHKTVMLINDVPVKKEILDGEKFSSPSNLSLLTALRTGRVLLGEKKKDEFLGIVSTDIFTTYMDYTYFGEEEDIERNLDYAQEIKRKKDLYKSNTREDLEEKILEPMEYFVEKQQKVLTRKAIKRITFYPLSTHKDLYISYRLKAQLDSLIAEIEEVSPSLLIVTGKWGLFFLSGLPTLASTQGNYKDRRVLGGLKLYRASMLTLHPSFNLGDKLLFPIYHTIHSLKMLEAVPIMRLDLEKLGYTYHTVKEEGVAPFLVPDKNYIVGLDKIKILTFLANLQAKVQIAPTYISMDIESMFSSIIDCIGVTDSIKEGISIPFASLNNPLLFSEEDEVEICQSLFTLMLHPNCSHVGQNYQYDTDFYSSIWGLQITANLDTLLLHHKLYNHLPKDLAFLASLYCETYKYWKADITATKETPETRWEYNCKDVCYTLEVAMVLKGFLEDSTEKLQELYLFESQKLVPVLDGMMRRGVLIDVKEKEKQFKFFSKVLQDIMLEVNDVIEEDFNINSWQQKQKVFEDLLGIELIRVNGKKTTNAASMLHYIEKYPLYRPFLTLLLEQSSLKIFTNNFLGMGLDDDLRARTQYKVCGTSTGRLSSTKNIRGKGANFQNIPSKGKIDLVQAATLVEGEAFESVGQQLEGVIKLPNIKSIFLADEGMEICDADYSGADIQVVAWESQCKWLMDYFSDPNATKVYKYIAEEFFQAEISNREYKTYKGIFHGSNYGMGIKKLAAMAGIPLQQAKQLQDFYFRLNPEIPKWQKRIEKQVANKGYIENIFGRRSWFINSNDPMLLNKALAFTPQSTIGDVVNRALVATTKYSEIIPMLQVHDSLVVQYNKEIAKRCREIIFECMEVVLPYKEPLIIPCDIQISTVSYGDVAALK